MRMARWISATIVSSTVVAACLAGAGPALAAKGGTAPATPTAPSAPCATLGVSGTTVFAGFTVPAFIKYTVANCGTQPLAATLTLTEGPGPLATVCPSPQNEIPAIVLAARDKVSAQVGANRSSCSLDSTGQVIPSIWGFQAHTVLLTLTDNATGTVLSTGSFSWQDDPAKS